MHNSKETAKLFISQIGYVLESHLITLKLCSEEWKIKQILKRRKLIRLALKPRYFLRRIKKRWKTVPLVAAGVETKHHHPGTSHTYYFISLGFSQRINAYF